MPLTEYEPGTAFPGVIGRTFDVSCPRGRGRCGARGSPERAVHRPRRHRLRPARLLRLPDPDAEPRSPGRGRAALHEHAHDRALLAAPLVHADRAQPPLERHVVHHRGRDRLPGRATASSRSRTASCPRSCMQHGYNTYAIGKWHLTPADQISAAGPYDRWPLGRGFERYYGFLGGDTHQYYPDLGLRQPPGRAAEDARGGLPPDRGSGRPRDRVHRRRQAGRARQAVLHVLLHRRDARAAPRAQGVGRQVRGRSSTTAGTRTARRSSRGRRSLGIVPPDTQLSRRDPDVQAVGPLLGRRAAALRAHDGGVRRLPRAHRPPHRPPARLPRGDRPARQHADHGRCPTTAPAPRAARTARSTRTCSSTTCPRRSRRTSRPSTSSAGPKYFNHYPWGWAWAGNTPVPPLEARDLPRRRQRSVHRPLAGGHHGQGRDPRPSTPTRSTWCPTVLEALGHRAADAACAA